MPKQMVRRPASANENSRLVDCYPVPVLIPGAVKWNLFMVTAHG